LDATARSRDSGSAARSRDLDSVSQPRDLDAASRSPDLLLPPLAAGPGRRVRLEGALRDAVRSGRLSAGSTLPSSRALAQRLGVSRRLVVEAYGQLVAEGYLVARRGAGTRVAERAAATRPAAPRPVPPAARPRWDLFPGHPDLSLFPRTAWLRAMRDTLAELPAMRLGYGWPGGARELRESIAERLCRVRGAATDPEHVVVFSGYLHGLHVLGAVLRGRGVARVAMEDPGFPLCADVLRSVGLEVAPIPVDEEGLSVSALAGAHVQAVVVTPAHAFPTGVVLSPERRTQLATWAQACDALVIEDDYDGEFRYDREPVGALQGLAPERVVLAGSLSKTLAPAVRLGWLALPEQLSGPVMGARALSGDTAGLGQLAAARLMSTGAYDRHLRSARLAYRRKREALLAALDEQLPGVRVHGVAAGLHVVLELPPGIAEHAVAAQAAQRGLRVYPLGRFCARAQPPPSLVIGYASVGEGALRDAVAVLADAVAAARVADSAGPPRVPRPRDVAPASALADQS
jgi:GntR family transcriptional regulator/MocR family aminotransferase